LPFATSACLPNGDGGVSCQFAACTDGNLRCPGDVGCETEISGSNCGACGNACEENELCVQLAGSDQFDCSETDMCPPGMPDRCGVTCVDLQVNLVHCGDCHFPPEQMRACAPAPHSAPRCEDGSCALNCVGSYRSCDDETPAPGTPEYANGCEVDTNSDINHCGSCGNVCSTPYSNREAYCEQGECKTRCTGTYLNCDGDPSCETPGNTLQNCYACGNECKGLLGLLPACCANRRGCGSVGCAL